MAARVLLNDSARGKSASVTINWHLKRATLNQAGLQLLRDHYPGDTNHVELLVDDDNPSMFWIRLTDQEAPGSRKMDRPSKSTCSINISLLIREMDLKLEETKRFPLTWDNSIPGARVDLKIEKEKEEKDDHL
jgi:hypothetical protein